jgi:hypothetical protein
MDMAREILAWRDAITDDLNRMLRDLDRLRVMFGKQLQEHESVIPFPARQIYVAGYVDEHGIERNAVVRTIARHGDGRFTLYTAAGDTVTLVPSQLSTWVHVLDRPDDPFPDNWWRS